MPSRRPHALYAMFVPSSVTVADMARALPAIPGGAVVRSVEQRADRAPHRVGEARGGERIVGVVGIGQA